ncbi:MAG: hypothetical protein C5B60_01575 [Chloroflexi bacterium]|nr:MAG: hypothetical protein C5B60_01575 [Chloroflexota bacterium]
MNATLYGILNGIATAAKNANDPDSISVCVKMQQLAEYAFGTTYDTATSAATPVVIFPSAGAYPAGSIAPTIDSIFALGVPNIRRVGG